MPAECSSATIFPLSQMHRGTPKTPDLNHVPAQGKGFHRPFEVMSPSIPPLHTKWAPQERRTINPGGEGLQYHPGDKTGFRAEL